MAPSIKLHYFNGTGRANQIRLALAAAGFEFEDVFTKDYPPSPEEKAYWAKLTNNSTTSSVPILTLDEGTENQKVYVQSSAILRKVARLGNLKMTLHNDEDGDNAAYLTDRAIADADDLRTASYTSFVFFKASQEKSDNFARVFFQKHVKSLENQFFSAGGDYWGGSSTISLADVTIYDAIVFFGLRIIEGIEGIDNPCGPSLKAWIDRVESNEGIKAYLESDRFKNIAMKPDKSALGY